MLNKNLSFYQISKHVLNKFGTDVAMVHAIIWNSSKMEGSVCKFGEAEIGNEIGVTYKVVNNCIKILLQAGYIIPIYEKNKYRTKAYRFVPEKIVDNITEEEYQEHSLKANNERIADHERSTWDESSHDTNRPMIQNVPSDDMNRPISCDETSHQMIQNVSSNDMNRPPIKNLNILKENKEKKEAFSSSFSIDPQHRQQVIEKLEYLIQRKADDKWMHFVDIVCREEIENKHMWEDFVKKNFWSSFDPTYAHPKSFIEKWTATEFPKYGYDPDFVKQAPHEPEQKTDDAYGMEVLRRLSKRHINN